jgi:thermitase
MATDPDDRLQQWQTRRAARLAALPWLHTDDTHRRQPVRYLRDELVVAADHEAAARQVLAGMVPARTITARPPIAGFVRLHAPGADIAAATLALRGQAGEDVVAPHHVFVSTPFEMGGPYGPPTSAESYPLSSGPAADAAIRLAVMDTAVWPDSPLPDTWYEADADDVDDSVEPGADLGHANFIIGVIMSNTDNARVRAIKVLDADGLCTEADLANALLALEDVDVVNLSLGGFTHDDRPPLILRAALKRLLHSRDRVVVAAAGNEGSESRPYWPAAFAGSDAPFAGQVLAVAAHDGARLCAWSNTGPWVDVAAPGADITSTYVSHDGFPTGFARWSGTSFAAPYVAAAIAQSHRTTGSVVGAAQRVKDAAAGQSYGGYPGLG